MANLTKKEKAGLKRILQKTAFVLTSKKIRVCEIPEGEGLGFTTSDNEIYLAFSDEHFLKSLSKSKTIRFIRGVFAHEIMHQLLSNFPVLNAAITVRRSIGYFECEYFKEINNILEDSYIENYAHLYLGDELLRDLYFMRSHVYAVTEPLDPSMQPIAQFTAAFIMYGDAGIVKGDFSSEEARDCFAEALPYMEKGMMQHNSRVRTEYAGKILDASRPLWTELDEEKAKELLEKLRELLPRLKEGSPMGGGISGTPLLLPLEDDSGSETDSSHSRAAKKRRAFTAKKYGSKAGKEESKTAEEGAACKESEEGEKGSEAPVPSEEPGAAESEGEDSPSGTDSSGPSSHMGSTESPDFSNPDSDTSDEESLIEELEEEMDFSKEDDARLKDELERAIHAEEADSEASKKAGEVPLDMEIGDGYKKICMGKNCANIRVKSGSSAYLRDTYQDTVAAMNTDIAHLTSQLKRIFQADREEKSYKSCGRLSVKRLTGGAVTTRVFEKKTAPANKADLAVCILVDESGSMGGEKIANARYCAIGLAESFSRLKIPLSVIGFSSDENIEAQHRDAVHRHYICWSTAASERAKLLHINDYCNNFDGYSIRYAAKFLSKREAAHHLLIVVSDGEPASCSYHSHEEGIMDTKMAIQEASKDATVIGILLGNESPEIHREMYGYHFLHIANPKELFTKLGKMIAKEIKGW